MPIGFARVEFVKRSEGKNAIAKSAYNSREKMSFEGNCVLKPAVYNFSKRVNPVYHEILLPEGVSENFKIAEVLWNAVEAKEKKINSQVAIDLVLALPDDEALTIEDRVELARGFVEGQIIKTGLAAQIDIHPPEKKILFTEDYELLGISKGLQGVVSNEKNGLLEVKLQNSENKEIVFNPEKFKGFQIKEHNWHAHVLATTRRFKSNGLEFEDHKPRELLPQVRKGRVVSGLDWGKLWTDHQNQFFKDRGMALRVDVNSIVPQEHLGPVRMRGRAFDLLTEHDSAKELNNQLSQSPKEALNKITERLSVFTKDDVDRFFEKHVQSDDYQTLKELFWQQPNIIQLLDKETGNRVDKFSTQEIIDEEKSIIRIANRIRSREALNFTKSKEAVSLTKEQKIAFSNVVEGQRLSCIQGFAGTGKSHLLSALAQSYQNNGYYVRAFGPDNATCNVLKEKKGLENSENVMKFLFALHNGKRFIRPGAEVWICDEAGKLGNKPLLELLRYAEQKKVQLVFSGDTKQLSSVSRGGMFKVFNERYGAEVLQDIQRQKNPGQLQVAIHLAQQKISSAINSLAVLNGFQWSETRKEAIEDLMTQWAIDSKDSKEEKLLILAHTNDEVRVLNELARNVKKGRGELGEREILCETSMGRIFVGVGDRIEFRKNDQKLGVTNGLVGTVVRIDEARLSVKIQYNNKFSKLVSFNPQKHREFQLGYASTYFRAQGATVDRAYILHSPYINKELFYVALTRHSKEAKYFLSKEEVPNLSFLKHLASRDNNKLSSLDYSNESDKRRSVIKEQTEQKIGALRQSESLSNQLKGIGIAAWAYVKEKTKVSKEFITDKLHDEKFYRPEIIASGQKGKSFEILSESNKADFIKGLQAYDSYKAANSPHKDLTEDIYKNLDSSFFKNVLTQTGNKHASFAEQFKLHSILFYFKQAREEGFQAKLNQLEGFSEKEKAQWGFQRQAMELINSQSKIKRSLSLNFTLNVKGGVRDQLVYQVMLFKAKFDREPTHGQMNIMKDVIQKCEKYWDFPKENSKDSHILECAKNKVLEKICFETLCGMKMDRKQLIIAKDSVVNEWKTIKNLETQYLFQGKSFEKDKGRELDIGINR